MTISPIRRAHLASGALGSAGGAGWAGAAGVAGPGPGAAGTAGAPGVSGAVGTTGAPGVSGAVGSGPPSSMIERGARVELLSTTSRMLVAKNTAARIAVVRVNRLA